MVPKVSIIIPVYNGSNFLKEAIDSAIAQTYNNIEIIVVNDGSNDDGVTEKIAKSYGNKVKYYWKENGGVASALNYGIEKMTGEYFSWLSHDDMYDKNKIKYQIKFLESLGRNDVIVACNAKVLYENGLTRKEYIDKQLFAYFDIFLAIAGDIGVNGCSLLIPRDILIKSKGFNPSLPVTQDYDLWFRLNKICNFVLLEKNLVISRRHSSQDSVKKQQICFEAGEKLHYDFLNQIKYEKFEDYMDEGGIKKTWDMYVLYRNNGYVKTASMILKYILEYYRFRDVKKFKSIINSELGEFVNIKIKGGNRKKILFFSNVWTKGGISKVMMYIFQNLSKNYDLILVTLDKNEYSEGYSLPKNISYIKISDKNQNSKIMNILTHFDIDIFVGNPNFIPSFVEIYKLIKGSKTKTIAYNHGHYFLPYMYQHLYSTAIKIKDAYNSADAVIWLSKTACNLYNIQNSNGVYLPNQVDRRVGIKPRNKFNKKLLAVGRFDDEIKRIDRIFMIFKEILKKDPDYYLDVVGSCPMDFVLRNQGGKTIGEFLKGLNIPIEKIKFWGDQADVSKYYKKADVLIMPSNCEGFGMVMAEALSFGLPCACSYYIGIDEIIQSGYNGWTSTDDIYLAERIVEIGEDLQKYKIMSKNAIKSVDKYDLTAFCDKWTCLIESLTENDGVKDYQKRTFVGALSKNDYEKIILEYELILNDVANNYINKALPLENVAPITSNMALILKFDDWIDRLKLSFKRDGVRHTVRKLGYKVYKKSVSLIKR